MLNRSEGWMKKGTGQIFQTKITVPFLFVESKAGFLLNQPPSYCLPRSVSGGDDRITGKPLQIEQGTMRKPIANKIDLILFPALLEDLELLLGGESSGLLSVGDDQLNAHACSSSWFLWH
jgi:hypothetical protein